MEPYIIILAISFFIGGYIKIVNILKAIHFCVLLIAEKQTGKDLRMDKESWFDRY